MTRGVPLYLVSACANASEFVAAFRRYADRTGLFVPIAEPLPPGAKGRMALTLTDGGVMLEGEVEVVSSTVKGAGLHGRAGMTLKFVEPDEPSKTVLGELEKARLAMKPAPVSVPPRPAEVPAAPRAVPPAVGGRIDAANALAECVAIGDIGPLRDAAAAKPDDALPKAGQKFVMPSIPSMGRPGSPTGSPDAGRAKTPSIPPEVGRAKTPSIPPEVGRAKTPSIPPEMGRAKTPSIPPEPASPPRSTRSQSPKPTALGLAVRVTQPLAVAKLPVTEAQGPGAPDVATTKPGREDPTAAMLMKPGLPLPRRAGNPSTPPMPRHPTPVAPLPVTRPPAKPAPSIADEADAEKTDLTDIPQAPLVGEEQKKTSLGIAMMTAAPVEASASDSGKAYVGPPPAAPDEPAQAEPAASVAPASRSGGMRASQIMAAIPATDDWTMTPDASGPTVLPASEKTPIVVLPEKPPIVVAPTTPPKGPPTGDWTIANDPEAGWSEPAKVIVAKQQPSTGNRVIAIASDKPIQAVEWEDKPTGIGEAKIEVDPTLMEPLKPMPVVTEDGFDPEPPAPMPLPPPAMAAPPQMAYPAQAMAFAPPPAPIAPPPMTGPQGQVAMAGFEPQRMVTDQGTGFFQESGQVARVGMDSQSVPRQQRSTRTLVIAVSAALVAVTGFVIVVMATGGKKHGAAHATGSGGSAALVVATGPGSGSAVRQPGSGGNQVAIAPGSAATHVEAPAIDAGVAVAPTCSVEVTTTPPGAEVAIDKTVLGQTPGTFPLPCGVEAKLGIRKAKYIGVYKVVTPTTEGEKVSVKLAAAVFSVKVTSMPPGATITVGGKPMGVTPTTIKLPAFAASTVTITKDGFAPDTQKLTVKQNNFAHHVMLKKTATPKRR